MEEGFFFLISFIFIYDVFKKMIKFVDYYFINFNFKVGYNIFFFCVCVLFDLVNILIFNDIILVLEYLLIIFFIDMYYNIIFDWVFLLKKECLKYGGNFVGNNCNFVFDIIFMFFIFFLGIYIFFMVLKKFKISFYFLIIVRKLISDFVIILFIFIFCVIDVLVGVDILKLIVLSEFKLISLN